MKLTTKILTYITILMLGLCATSCGLMHDDLEECAVRPKTRTVVHFIYQHNTDDVDHFADLVGAVTLYIFDANGKLVTSEEVTNNGSNNALRQEGFAMEFDESRLPSGQTYRFYAVAHQHPGGYDQLVGEQLPAFRRGFDPALLTVDNFRLFLESDEDNIVNHRDRMVDDLWTSRGEFTAEVPRVEDPAEGAPQEPDWEYEITIPLHRVTNKLTVRFWVPGYPEHMLTENYDMKITMPRGNKVVDILGNNVDETPAEYHPHDMVAEDYVVNGQPVRCIKAEFGLSRLMLTDDATLVVHDNTVDYTTHVDKLHQKLAAGNQAYDYKYWSNQEYLDRQHDHELSFPMDGDIPTWVQVSISALGWAVRLQDVALE